MGENINIEDKKYDYKNDYKKLINEYDKANSKNTEINNSNVYIMNYFREGYILSFIFNELCEKFHNELKYNSAKIFANITIFLNNIDNKDYIDLLNYLTVNFKNNLNFKERTLKLNPNTNDKTRTLNNFISEQIFKNIDNKKKIINFLKYLNNLEFEPEKINDTTTRYIYLEENNDKILKKINDVFTELKNNFNEKTNRLENIPYCLILKLYLLLEKYVKKNKKKIKEKKIIDLKENVNTLYSITEKYKGPATTEDISSNDNDFKEQQKTLHEKTITMFIKFIISFFRKQNIKKVLKKYKKKEKIYSSDFKYIFGEKEKELSQETGLLFLSHIFKDYFEEHINFRKKQDLYGNYIKLIFKKNSYFTTNTPKKIEHDKLKKKFELYKQTFKSLKEASPKNKKKNDKFIKYYKNEINKNKKKAKKKAEKYKKIKDTTDTKTKKDTKKDIDNLETNENNIEDENNKNIKKEQSKIKKEKIDKKEVIGYINKELSRQGISGIKPEYQELIVQIIGDIIDAYNENILTNSRKILNIIKNIDTTILTNMVKDIEIDISNGKEIKFNIDSLNINKFKLKAIKFLLKRKINQIIDFSSLIKKEKTEYKKKFGSLVESLFKVKDGQEFVLLGIELLKLLIEFIEVQEPESVAGGFRKISKRNKRKIKYPRSKKTKQSKKKKTLEYVNNKNYLKLTKKK